MAILPKNIWEFLAAVEQKLRKVIRGVGKMDHEAWRRFHNDARSEDCKGIIDGDLVEMFLVRKFFHFLQHISNNFQYFTTS